MSGSGKARGRAGNGTGAAAAVRRVLVTGGTGFFGEHVVARLLEVGGYEVRVLARSHAASVAARGVDIVRGDITAGPELAETLAGMDGVFHLAGVVSRDPDDAHRMMEVHIGGTRRLVRAAAEAGVARVVVASSSGTIAVSRFEEVRDESAGYATEVVAGWPYYASKIYQEKVAFELGEELGVEVVAVNPSLLLGPGDRRLSSTRDVLRFLRRQIPVVPSGGVSFVDVRDAAAATVAAMEAGRAGERYLLGGPNWPMAEFFGRLSRVAKVDPPRFRLPGRLSRWGATVMEEVARARGVEPAVDRVSVEMSEHFWYCDSSKAKRELGFEPRDPGLTLADTVRYLRQTVATDE